MRKVIETFFDAWGMSDANARHAAISSAFAPNGRYADPRSNGELIGAESITDYVAMFSENAPGWIARVVKTDETAETFRATVAFGGKGPDGADMIQHGQYFIECADGKIAHMVGFVGTGEPE